MCRSSASSTPARRRTSARPGICVVIVRDDLIGKARPGTPSVWDFKAMADEGSMLNTPPTFGWYFAGLVFKWLKKQGGLEAMEQRNRAKAEKLYGFIDGSRLLQEPGGEECRSWMNVPFTLAKPDLDKTFCAEAAKAGLVNLEGHRSVGGMRASIYNAMSHRRRRRAGEVHEGRSKRTQRLRSTTNAIQDPDSEQHQHQGARAAAARTLRGRLGHQQSRRHPGALGGHAQAGGARESCAPSAAPAPAPTTFRSRRCRKRGIPVFNAPGANANAVKELVLAGMFLAARNIAQAWAFAKVAER